MFILKSYFFLRLHGLNPSAAWSPINCRSYRKPADSSPLFDPFYSMSPMRFRCLESGFRRHDSVSYMSDSGTVGFPFRRNPFFFGSRPTTKKKERTSQNVRSFVFPPDFSLRTAPPRSVTSSFLSIRPDRIPPAADMRRKPLPNRRGI